MKAASYSFGLPAACAAILASGCLVPQSQLANSQAQNRVLAEQNRAQLIEIENLKAHTRQTEDQLIRAERELALPGQSADSAKIGARPISP
ncbi:MAG: hypothetical protein ABSF26_12405 [Thermoguttaceae bacterium]|jgi:hypothetical protein